eukprot:EG_transcript_51482
MGLFIFTEHRFDQYNLFAQSPHTTQRVTVPPIVLQSTSAPRQHIRLLTDVPKNAGNLSGALHTTYLSLTGQGSCIYSASVILSILAYFCMKWVARDAFSSSGRNP